MIDKDYRLKGDKQIIMKTNGETRFSDGTCCDYCGNLILTKIGIDNYIKEKNNDFCCEECFNDYVLNSNFK